jgi:hypothetical protein
VGAVTPVGLVSSVRSDSPGGLVCVADLMGGDVDAISVIRRACTHRLLPLSVVRLGSGMLTVGCSWLRCAVHFGMLLLA